MAEANLQALVLLLFQNLLIKLYTEDDLTGIGYRGEMGTYIINTHSRYAATEKTVGRTALIKNTPKGITISAKKRRIAI